MLIILDRDGVINHDSDQFIKSPEEWTPIPGSLEAIAKLKTAGHQVAIATNQSGLGRGLFSQETLELIHDKLNQSLGELGTSVDALVYCPHLPTDGCDCRKPKSGLMKQIDTILQTGFKQSWVVGDSLRDLIAGAEVGCHTILVGTGKGEKTLAAGGLPQNTEIVENLAAAVEFILDQTDD